MTHNKMCTRSSFGQRHKPW